MATEKQKMAVDNIVENGGNVSKAMRDAGYTNATAKTPQKLTESVGFKELCNEHGLTDSLILDALVEDIKKKKQNRKPELELGAKIRGMLVDKSEVEHTGEVNLKASDVDDKDLSELKEGIQLLLNKK